jgi:hypothetical protein
MAAIVSVEDLSEDDRELVVQFVGFLRRTRRDPDARADLLRHWEAIRNAPDVLTPEEADALAAEAVAYVRAHA